MIRIRQDGPSQYQIRQGNKAIGYIWKHPDGWRGKIDAHEAIAATPDDACEEVWAKVSGQSIAEIREKNDGISLGMKQSKQYISSMSRIKRLLHLSAQQGASIWLKACDRRYNGSLRGLAVFLQLRTPSMSKKMTFILPRLVIWVSLFADSRPRASHEQSFAAARR